MRPARLAIHFVTVTVALGCSAEAPVVVIDIPTAAADAPAPGDSAASADVAPEPADDGAPTRGGIDDPTCQEAGCPGWPCSENKECSSDYCVWHLGERVCTTSCITSCPDGWSCSQVTAAGTDVSFICTSDHPTLCLPCSGPNDCAALTGAQATCRKAGESGAFCATACSPGEACPAGYECVTGGCVPQAGDCACGATAVMLALSAECVRSNEHGTCWGTRVCTSGGLTPCSADTPAAEICDGVDNDCDNVPDEDTCDDSELCTADECVAAGCQHTPILGAPCDDGSLCTSSDSCGPGGCAGVPVPCDDSDPCLEAACDPQSGACEVSPAADGTPCSAGSCSQADTCLGGTCQAGAGVSCDDQNPCTSDTCSPSQGCLHAPLDGAQCDDGNACTELDTCSGAWCLGLGTSCDDQNPCTTDSCVPGSGCVYAPSSGASCSDPDPCTVSDSCVDGACAPGITLECNDQNPCTSDSCGLAGCVYVPKSQGTPCDDQNPCTAGDGCSGGGCAPGGASPCDPNALCGIGPGNQAQCQCNLGYSGNGYQCTDQALALTGLRLEMPCTNDASPICNAPDPTPVSTQLGGPPGKAYQVSLRFRGVVEQKTYLGGTNDGAFRQVGGSEAADGFNVYRLTVSQPPQVYYLNRGQSKIYHCFPIDYTRTVTIQAGATIGLVGEGKDGLAIANVGADGAPIVIPGVPPAPQPFAGQFIQVDVLSVVPVP